MQAPRTVVSLVLPALPLLAAAIVAVVIVRRHGTPAEIAWTVGALLLTFVAWGLLVAVCGRRSKARIRHIHEAVDRLVDGRYGQPIEASGRDEIGELAASVARLQDATTRRLAELTRKARVIEAVLMAVPEGLVAVGPAGDVRYANRAAQQLVGVRADRSGMRSAASPGIRESLAELLEQVRTTKAPARSRARFREDGGPIVSVLAAPVDGEFDLAAVFVIYDDTELSRAESLRQEFVANVSHELKTPLSSIKAYAETLSGGAIDDPPHNLRFVHRIEEQADRLHQLILDLLQLARIESGRQSFDIQAVDLASIVELCLDGHRDAAAAKGIALCSQSVDRSVMVRADAEGLRQIVDNLVDNAVKYTLPSGTVTVGWGNEGTFVRLAVRDTGIGIAAEHHHRLFERFYRVDKARSRELGGTGLGLSIVKHLAQSFGGDVTLDSTVGEGCTFCVDLPAA